MCIPSQYLDTTISGLTIKKCKFISAASQICQFILTYAVHNIKCCIRSQCTEINILVKCKVYPEYFVFINYPRALLTSQRPKIWKDFFVQKCNLLKNNIDKKVAQDIHYRFINDCKDISYELWGRLFFATASRWKLYWFIHYTTICCPSSETPKWGCLSSKQNNCKKL